MTTPAEAPADTTSAGQQDTAGAPKPPADPPAIKPIETGPSPALVAARKAKADADAALAAAEKEGTPAGTPAAAATPKDGEKPPLETVPNPDPKWQAEYATFDDPSAQAAVDLMKEAKVSPIEANAFFEKAIKSGDLKDVDWAGLEQKVGKTKALLIKNGVETYYNTTYATTQQTVQDVHGVFGGKDGWETVKTWAQTNEKTDPALKKNVDAIRKMIDQGGVIATTGAEKLKALYDADPKTKGLGTGKVLQGDGLPSTVEGGPLNKADYFTQNKAAQAKGDYALVEQLRARRAAGIRAGIN